MGTHSVERQGEKNCNLSLISSVEQHQCCEYKRSFIQNMSLLLKKARWALVKEVYILEKTNKKHTDMDAKMGHV